MSQKAIENPISVKNVTYTYPEQDAPALRDVSLEVERGEYLVVMGGGGGDGTQAASRNTANRAKVDSLFIGFS